MKRWAAILCITLSAAAQGQTRAIDSLRHVIHSSPDNEQKLAAIFELNEQPINADTLFPYVALAATLAVRSEDKDAVAKAAFCHAGYYARKNMIDSSRAITNDLISKYKNREAKKALHLRFLFFRAKLSDRENQYSRSLTQLHEVVQMAAAQQDTAILIQATTGIGWVLIEMEQYAEALKWLRQAARTSNNNTFYQNYGALLSNTAVAFNGLGQRDSALYYINKAVADARRNEHLLFLATALSMQAKIFVDNGMSHLAESPLQEVLSIRKKLNDAFYTVFDISNLASYYAKNDQPEKGIRLCNEGITIAKRSGLASQLLMVYKALAENYKAQGNEKEYANTLEHIVSLKDSFNNINSAKMLAEMQAANEARRQEQTITEQRLKITEKNYLLWGSMLFALMAAIIGWLAFKNYKRRQKLSLELAIEKERINAAQAVKEAEEQERRRIAADLHDNLGAQANAILYSAELLQQEKEQKEVLVADLHHTAKDMLTSLRETLWVLKSTEVTAAEVWLRIINFSKQLNRHYPDLVITTQGAAPKQLQLPSARALNIVFIVQEAINNAVRHAAANSVLINSSFIEDRWFITVKDDGRGFDLAAANRKQESYGLSNMMERASAARLELNIETVPNRGTTVDLKMPYI